MTKKTHTDEHADPPGAPWWLPVMLLASIPCWVALAWILSMFE